MFAPSTRTSIQLKYQGLTTDQGLSHYVLLTAKSVTGLKGITLNTVTRLSDIPKKTISFDTLQIGRLYIARDTFTPPPTPTGNLDYGWIELTKVSPTAPVWINLTAVDEISLPLILSGTEANSGKAFSLGYRIPIAADPGAPSLISMVEAILVDQTPVINTTTGETKIAAPTQYPDSYPSFAPYLKLLSDKKRTPITIQSDSPSDGPPKLFKGYFEKAQILAEEGEPNGDLPIITLTSQDSAKDKLVIQCKDFTSEIIYRCGGGELLYNGVSYPQNRTAENDPGSTANQRLITNSVFRELVIGINEGYFSPDGPNDSRLFSGMEPFSDNRGNLYAKAVYQASNAYGFPYADANLKTLIKAQSNGLIKLGILSSNQTQGYQNYPKTPSDGLYQFGIGADSQSLGAIRISDWTYEANDDGAYGGYLPYLPEWTRMHFTGLGSDHYIWIKNGAVEAGNCLSAAPSWNSNQTYLSWPADLSWVTGQTPPAKPT